MSGLGDKVKGKVNEVKGGAKEADGNETGNEEIAAEGKVDQAKGKGQGVVGATDPPGGSADFRFLRVPGGPRPQRGGRPLLGRDHVARLHRRPDRGLLDSTVRRAGTQSIVSAIGRCTHSQGQSAQQRR